VSSALTSRIASADWGKLRGFEERLFTTRNLRLFGLFWITANAAALARLFLGGLWPIITRERPGSCIDFGWMWLSSRFAALPDPARIYDYGEFAKAQSDLFGAGNCVLLTPFVYPPTYLFFTSPLGHFSFVSAFVLWNAALLLFFGAVVYAIVRHWKTILAAVTLRPVQADVYVGHNGLLTSGLMGSALVMLETRPLLAGFFLALLTYKPQFGLLFPVALLASQNWRALASAGVFSIAFALAAALTFGAHSWPAFLSSLLSRSGNLSPDPAVQLPLMSIYGIVQSAGFGAGVAFTAQAAVTLVLAAAVWMMWSKPIPYAIRAAFLCIASLMATPYALAYDFSALAIALAFLLSDGLSRGFATGERMAMLFCWLAPLTLAGARIGPLIVCAVLLLLISRRLVMLRTEGAPA